MISKQIIQWVVRDLPSNTHNEFHGALIEYDLDDKGIELNNSISSNQMNIINYLIQNPTIKNNHGESIVEKLVNRMIKRMLNFETPFYNGFDSEKQVFEDLPDFYKYLRFDGYDIDFEEQCLIMGGIEQLEISQKEDQIISFLNLYNFHTTKGHFLQAKGSYMGDNFAALNSQLRTFVESLLQEMAQYIKICEPNNSSISFNELNAQTGMQVLAKCTYPVLDINLNEWKEESKGYFNAFWARLHPEGSHPGLPDIEEVLYRFQLVILNCLLIIKRFRKNYPVK